MWFGKNTKDKTLRMVWEVSLFYKKSFLVGTAHFFPYSFQSSLTEIIRQVDLVLLEGPLDQGNLNKAVESGVGVGQSRNIIDALDRKTLRKIIELFLPGEFSRFSFIGTRHSLTPEETLISELERMKPWLMFFTIYKGFLDKKGWRYSVDLEAYSTAQRLGKDIGFLETIDEQIEVLNNISTESIIDFLSRIQNWNDYIKDFTKWYLEGDLQKIAVNPYKFPTRSPYVIQRRDKILCDRMLPHLKQGNVASFVGIPHVQGIKRILLDNGFKVDQIVV